MIDEKIVRELVEAGWAVAESKRKSEICGLCNKTIQYFPCGLGQDAGRNVVGCFRIGKHFHLSCNCRGRDKIVEVIGNAKK
jgi:hypothetical protein